MCSVPLDRATFPKRSIWVRGVHVHFQIPGLFHAFAIGFDLLRFVPACGISSASVNPFSFLQSFLRSISLLLWPSLYGGGELLFQRRGKHGKSFFGGRAFFA